MVLLYELLFWGHIALILFALTSGFFLPFSLIIALIILHRIHILIFGNCLFSHLQASLGAIHKGETFLQVAVKELFSKKIDERQSGALDWSIVFLTFLIAVVNQI